MVSPEKLTAKLESEARRVEDKAARWRKVPRRAQREKIRWIGFALYTAAKDLDELLKRWEREAPEEVE